MDKFELFNYDELNSKLNNSLKAILDSNLAKNIASSIVQELQGSIKSTIEFLERQYPPSKLDNSNSKIRLKLSKKEVCVLFKVLSDLNFIDGEQSSEKELGELLELHFQYYNSQKKFVDIREADGYFKKLRTNSKYANQSDKLNKLFSYNK
jgi:hypothetical protein